MIRRYISDLWPQLLLSSVSEEKRIPSSNLLQELQRKVDMRTGCCDHRSSVPCIRHVSHIWSGSCISGGQEPHTHRRYRHINGLDYVHLALVHTIPFIIHFLKNTCIFFCWKAIQIIYQLCLYPVISKGVRIDKKLVWMFQKVKRNRVFWRRGAFDSWDVMSLYHYVSQVSSYFLQNIA